MTTGETNSIMAYQVIVQNLLALRAEAREANGEDIRAINSVLASVMSLQLIDRFSRISVPSARKSEEPVLAGTSDRASKEFPNSLIDHPWAVPRLARLASN